MVPFVIEIAGEVEMNEFYIEMPEEKRLRAIISNEIKDPSLEREAIRLIERLYRLKALIARLFADPTSRKTIADAQKMLGDINVELVMQQTYEYDAWHTFYLSKDENGAMVLPEEVFNELSKQERESESWYKVYAYNEDEALGKWDPEWENPQTEKSPDRPG